jgi:DnaK suppressor protein
MIMKAMTPAQRIAFRTALIALRDETLAAGPQKIEPNRKDVAQVGVADEDEQALGEMMQTLASKRNEQQARLLAQIAKALGKLADTPDEYGLCEDCEEEIPTRRLELMPYVAHCAECQAKRDPRRGRSRKSTTDFE